MLNMKDHLVEKLGDVGIVQPVNDLLATPLADYEPELAERAQLVRNRRSLHVDCFCQCAYRARSFLQPTQYLHPARRSEHLHPFRHRPRQVSVDHIGGVVGAVAHPNE